MLCALLQSHHVPAQQGRDPQGHQAGEYSAALGEEGEVYGPQQYGPTMILVRGGISQVIPARAPVPFAL